MIKRKHRLLPCLVLLISCATPIVAHEIYAIKTYASIHKRPANYSIKINYPFFKNSLYAKSINRIIHTAVNDKITQIHHWMLAGDPPNTTSEFTSEAKVISHQQGRYSIAWFDLNYFAGAAHPEHVIHVLNYDVKTKKRLSLSDMLSTKPASLEHISLLSRQSLRHQFHQVHYSPTDTISRKWFEQGTSPTLKNFKNWSFTPQEIHFYFPEYSIAPYVYGAFKVTIPRK